MFFTSVEDLTSQRIGSALSRLLERRASSARVFEARKTEYPDDASVVETDAPIPLLAPMTRALFDLSSFIALIRSKVGVSQFQS